jgi:hypothetical protein
MTTFRSKQTARVSMYITRAWLSTRQRSLRPGVSFGRRNSIRMALAALMQKSEKT